MNHHDDFFRKLDAELLTGASLSKIALRLGINMTTVKRRKQTLRRAGHTFSTKGFMPESLREPRGVSNAKVNTR